MNYGASNNKWSIQSTIDSNVTYSSIYLFIVYAAIFIPTFYSSTLSKY